MNHPPCGAAENPVVDMKIKMSKEVKNSKKIFDKQKMADFNTVGAGM